MLKSYVNDLSEVAENNQSLYKEYSDGYLLDVEPANGYDIQNISGLTTTLEKKKRELELANTNLKAYGDIDPDEIQRKLARYDKIKNLNPEKLTKEHTKIAVQAQEAEFQKQIETLQGQINGRDESIKVAALNEVFQVIEKAGGNAEYTKNFINTVCKVSVDESGKPELKIMNTDGQTERITIKDGKQEKFTVDDLINDMKKDNMWKQMFNTQGISGTGGQSSYSGMQSDTRYITSEQASSGDYNKELADGSVSVQN